MADKPPIEPRRWQPPQAAYPVPDPTPVTVRRIPLPDSAEDPVIRADGMIFTGLDHGRVIGVTPDGEVSDVATVGHGRLLGVELHPDGGLVVCSAQDGVFHVDLDSGAVEPLATHVEGRPLVYADNGHVLDDGTVLFSEASQRFGHEFYMADFIEHSASGSLWARMPNGTVDCLLSGLSFANGITNVPGEDAVLVAETSGYAIQKVWLSGDRAGQSETFVDGFPGMFDNLTTGPSGTIWAAIVNPRNALLDFLLPRAPVLRKAAWAMPEWARPGPTKICRIAGFDASGRVTHFFEAPADQYNFTTGVREFDGKLYLASLENDALGVIDLPA